jgi:hypothetical protein
VGYRCFKKDLPVGRKEKGRSKKIMEIKKRSAHSYKKRENRR